jgi:hypothetical protein
MRGPNWQLGAKLPDYLKTRKHCSTLLPAVNYKIAAVTKTGTPVISRSAAIPGDAVSWQRLPGRSELFSSRGRWSEGGLAGCPILTSVICDVRVGILTFGRRPPQLSRVLPMAGMFHSVPG